MKYALVFVFAFVVLACADDPLETFKKQLIDRIDALEKLIAADVKHYENTKAAGSGEFQDLKSAPETLEQYRADITKYTRKDDLLVYVDHMNYMEKWETETVQRLEKIIHPPTLTN
ncbi:unnamed protein product [Oppiella nova]|uniref:Uncharacterized protein n=1 Tax=Oppiella nova TaxID=334625 RepID=A0A7R9LRL1_9ACAR|nr:unnamed protein product [Oppiella nova]CAG2166243.1 unnamed protein product [Oppiella nova]